MSLADTTFALAPRDGASLRVPVIARISTDKQDERSLDDQVALCERHVRDAYPGPVEFIHIKSQGSGEWLDRDELRDAEVKVESATFDLIILEDLGRICRRGWAVSSCELCEDVDTRLIALNDFLDTAREDWRLNALFASVRHESYNRDTANRIRRSLRNRFEKGGAYVASSPLSATATLSLRAPPPSRKFAKIPRPSR